MSNGHKLTQMPPFAERVVLAGKPAAVHSGIGQSEVAAGSTAVAAAALPPRLVALPHIVPVGHMGRMR